MKQKNSFLKKIFSGILILGVLAGISFAVMPLPGTIPVLMYHFVGDASNNPSIEGNFVSEPSFARQMAFLKKHHFRMISLDDYYAIQTGTQKPRGREVVITFDDGDFSFAKYAVPILEKYNFPVTAFLVSELIKTGEAGSMKLETILELQKNYPWIHFQSHTKTHPHLKEITEAQLKDELEGSRRDLSEMLGKPILDLAYTFGEFDQRVLKATQEAGYRMAFTTGHKRLKGLPEGLYSRTRIKISRISDLEIVFWYQLSGLHQVIKGTREKIRNVFSS